MNKIVLLIACVLFVFSGTAGFAAQKRTYNIESSPESTPFSAVVQADNILFVSGQLGVDADGNIPESFEKQMALTFNNISVALKLAGATLDDVVKVTVFLDDMDNFKTMNQIYTTYFTKDRPARSTVEVSELAMGAKVEIEVIAVKR